ncbi:uncharacterized protein LOC107214681 isoform X2 [Parus major]|uniref:uncharacterized protein LOC107214681 isoform X2 n=1 Tax=Parus major TaxID=9157 RepID=UPI0007714CE0|nr:uncharacterized protein LOC107214681 isoform X2 [Parus major]XP_018864512.1 uncharacterized protein LOC107214681 isoform X2 [Parus major]
MRTHPAALTLPGENFPRSAIQPSETPPQRETSTAGTRCTGHGTRDPLSPPRCSSGHSSGSLPLSTPPESFPAPPDGSGRARGAGAEPLPAADTQRRTMNLCIAVLLLLHSLTGKAEVQDDMEEMTQDLYDYMAHLSNYYYSTEDYYYDNITATPATYMYELDTYETSTIGEVDWEKWFPVENATTMISGLPDTNAPGDSRDVDNSQDSQESLGPSLQGHLTLIILLSFLSLLL